MRLFFLPLITLALLANEHYAVENEAAYTKTKRCKVTFSPQSYPNGTSPPESDIYGRSSRAFAFSRDAVLRST